MENSLEVLRLPGLRIMAHVEDHQSGRVSFRASGLLRSLGKRITDSISDYFSGERPLPGIDGRLAFSTWIPPIPSKSFTRLVRNQIRIARTGKRIPEQVSIAVTGRCPCDCVFCCAKGIRAEPELTLAEMKNVIDQAVRMGTHLLTFDGGETLLRKDIFEIITYASSTGSHTVMFTNGLYLNSERASRLREAGLGALQISIDSPYEEDHDRTRRLPGIFSKATAGARLAVEHGLATSLYYVARPENSDWKTLRDLLELGRTLGVHEVTVYDILAIGKWLDHEAETLSDEDRGRAIALHKEVNAPGQTGPKVMAFSYFESPEMFGCMAGRRWVHITPAGDVIPCSYTPIAFGNVREERLSRIWQRIRRHPEYRAEKRECMVQDPEFRRKYIYTIPRDASLPYPVGSYAREEGENRHGSEFPRNG